MSGILWGPQHPDTQAALTDLARRVEALEQRQRAPQCPAWKLDHVGYCCGGSDPEPVPEWRRLVDKAADAPAGYATPLADVLALLCDVEDFTHERGGWDIPETLARIVAVAEGQVGDGWQADPEGGYHADSRPMCDVDCLLGAFGYSEMWRVLGSRAAAWLRDLTEGGAA